MKIIVVIYDITVIVLIIPINVTFFRHHVSVVPVPPLRSETYLAITSSKGRSTGRPWPGFAPGVRGETRCFFGVRFLKNGT